MPANVVLHAVRAHYHREGVPADQTLDPPLQFLIAREERLEPRGNRVRVRRIRGKWQIDAGYGGVRAEPLQYLSRHFRPARLQHGVQRLQPFLNLRVFQSVRYADYFARAIRVCVRLIVHKSGWSSFVRFWRAGPRASQTYPRYKKNRIHRPATLCTHTLSEILLLRDPGFSRRP